MTYEAAKAVTILALTTSRLRDRRRSHDTLRARAPPVRARGQPGLAGPAGFLRGARPVSRGALRARGRGCAGRRAQQFAQASLPGKAALCDLLLSRLALQAGDLPAAEQACQAALEQLASAETPMLAYQAHCVLGLLREAQGEPDRAYEAFQRADDSLEHLRNHLQSESLRVAFLEDKLDVYERLVTTCLTGNRTTRTRRRRSGTSKKPNHAAWRTSSPFARSTSRRGSRAPRVTSCGGCGRN